MRLPGVFLLGVIAVALVYSVVTIVGVWRIGRRTARCPRCGYEADGARLGVCSECGLDLARAGVDTAYVRLRFGSSRGRVVVAWLMVGVVLCFLFAGFVPALLRAQGVLVMLGDVTYTGSYSLVPRRSAVERRDGTLPDYALLVNYTWTGTEYRRPGGGPVREREGLAIDVQVEGAGGATGTLRIDATTGALVLEDASGAEVMRGAGRDVVGMTRALFEMDGGLDVARIGGEIAASSEVTAGFQGVSPAMSTPHLPSWGPSGHAGGGGQGWSPALVMGGGVVRLPGWLRAVPYVVAVVVAVVGVWVTLRRRARVLASFSVEAAGRGA